MKYIYSIFCTCIIYFLIASCSENHGSSANKRFYDYENLSGYIKDPTLVNTLGHSGNYCLQLDTVHAFGLGFRMPLKELSGTKIQKIRVRAWGLCNSFESKGQLVCAIDSSGKNIFRNAIDFNDFIEKPGQWFEITGEINVTNFNDSLNQLVIYPWSNGKDVLYFDDLEISVL